MAPHTKFKLAVIRTMRCDFCNESNTSGLQECVDCSLHICQVCVEGGSLNDDKKHRMEQKVIDKLKWKTPDPSRRATARHRKAISVSESTSPPAISSNQHRRQVKLERRLQNRSDHNTGTYYNPGPQFQSILPRPPQNANMWSGGNFNAPAGIHEQIGDVHGHGHFQFGSAPPGYPPGYNSSFPTLAMPRGVPPFVPGQHGQPGQLGQPGQPGQPAQPPNQGGLAMPMGPFYGHHFPVNPGLPPHGDPRLNTPPGPQFTHSGYPAPNNFGGFPGGQPLGFSPAPTPAGFAGPGFHQHVPQPPATYNDRGYVPHGNMAPGQPVPGAGPFPFAGQPYGGGPFPYAPPPPQNQGPPHGQAVEPPSQSREATYLAELERQYHTRHPTPHGHAGQPDSLSNKEQQQREQNPWEHVQHSSPPTNMLFGGTQGFPQQQHAQAHPAWEPSRSGPPGYPTQAPSEPQTEGDKVQLQPRTQRDSQHLAQQSQRQVREQHQTQPEVLEPSQTVQEAPKQDEKREEKPREHQAKREVGRPIPESAAIVGPPPVTSSHTDACPITLPPIVTPPVIASSVQKTQRPDSAPAPRLPTLEPDPNSQLSRVQLSEAYATTPSVVAHAQRSFGIPALSRDLFQGRPNHYDETAARWAELERARRPSPDDDYDDDDDYSGEGESETGGDMGKGKGKEPAQPDRPSDQQLPGRGKKRTFSQASSAVDSTLSAELLDQPFTPANPAVVPNTEALRRKLRDDANIARARREDGERAALDMAAAANTLQGGGRGLRGVADAQVVANDREIRRRQENVDRKGSGRRGRGAGR